ncbi:hypothetical protein B0J14DRAFT_574837 [Halenospora varia]|nr:hypothetical protein B0J14DRAFT_574837 [Halenospora varia]
MSIFPLSPRRVAAPAAKSKCNKAALQHHTPKASTLSSLERLPVELLLKILSSLNTTITKDDATHLRDILPRNPNQLQPLVQEKGDFLSCLLVSKTLHHATLPLLYNTITLSSQHAVETFSSNLGARPHLGQLIRTLDLSLLFNIPLPPRSQRSSMGKLIQGALPLLTRLRELKVPQQFDSNLDLTILTLLLSGKLPSLKNLDIGPACSASAISSILAAHPSHGVRLSITSLRLRSVDFDLTPVAKELLSCMSRLKHLDVSQTNLECDVLRGLTENVSLKTLVVRDSARFAQGFNSVLETRPELFREIEVLDLEGAESDFDGQASVVDQLPKSLRSLDLGAMVVTASEVQKLMDRCEGLEELALGVGLTMRDVETMILPSGVEFEQDESPLNIGYEGEQYFDNKYHNVLEPMAKSVAICKLRRRLNSVVVKSKTGNEQESRRSRLRYLDVRNMVIEEQQKIRTSVLLAEQSSPLEIIEISEYVHLQDELLEKVCGAVGWRVCHGGRSCWLERKSTS